MHVLSQIKETWNNYLCVWSCYTSSWTHLARLWALWISI